MKFHKLKLLIDSITPFECLTLLLLPRFFTSLSFLEEWHKQMPLLKKHLIKVQIEFSKRHVEVIKVKYYCVAGPGRILKTRGETNAAKYLEILNNNKMSV